MRVIDDAGSLCFDDLLCRKDLSVNYALKQFAVHMKRPARQQPDGSLLSSG